MEQLVGLLKDAKPRETKVLCFDLMPDDRSAAHYLKPSDFEIFSAANKTDNEIATYVWFSCSKLGPKNALVPSDNVFLLIRDQTSLTAAEYEALTYNVTATSVSPIDVAPVRQSGGGGKERPTYRYILIPLHHFQGDTAVQISISALRRIKGNPAANPPTVDSVTVETWLDQPLPQVHKPSNYSIATGVVWSSLTSPTFSRVLLTSADTTVTPNIPATYKTISDQGTFTTTPALFFTAYIVPMDTERPARGSDRIPRPTVGFSLTSPASNLFLGGSSELYRNVELVGGLHIGQVNYLSSQQQQPATDSAAPVVVQRTGFGGFVGITFNIDFITGLFKK